MRYQLIRQALKHNEEKTMHLLTDIHKNAKHQRIGTSLRTTVTVHASADMGSPFEGAVPRDIAENMGGERVHEFLYGGINIELARIIVDAKQQLDGTPRGGRVIAQLTELLDGINS
jgi:hypothetical protein